MKYLLMIVLLTTSCMSAELKMIGKSLLEYSIFKIDVYEISYWSDDSGVEEIHLDYKIAVEKKHSILGWREGLKHLLNSDPKLEDKLKWILDNTVDYADGDQVVLKKFKNQVSISLNNKLLATIEDSVIAKLIFEPWLGAKPIDEDIKNELKGIK